MSGKRRPLCFIPGRRRPLSSSTGRKRPLRSISGRKCCEHSFGEPCTNTYVECAAVETLAVFGDPEGGALQHRVGLGPPIGGEDACALRITCIHTGDANAAASVGYPQSGFLHIDTRPVRNWDLDENGLGSLLFDGQRLRFNDKERSATRVRSAHINSDRRRGMEVAQEHREISHCRGKRPVIVTVLSDDAKTRSAVFQKPMNRCLMLSLIAGAVVLPGMVHAVPAPQPTRRRLRLSNPHTGETFDGLYPITATRKSMTPT